MAWIDVLQQREATWQEFKSDLRDIINEEKERLLSKEGEELLVQKGRALMARELLRRWTSKERQHYAEAVRREREPAAEPGRFGEQRVTVLGFDRH